jgi:hypothetical protein
MTISRLKLSRVGAESLATTLVGLLSHNRIGPCFVSDPQTLSCSPKRPAYPPGDGRPEVVLQVLVKLGIALCGNERS